VLPTRTIILSKAGVEADLKLVKVDILWRQTDRTNRVSEGDGSCHLQQSNVSSYLCSNFFWNSRKKSLCTLNDRQRLGPDRTREFLPDVQRHVIVTWHLYVYKTKHRILLIWTQIHLLTMHLYFSRFLLRLTSLTALHLTCFWKYQSVSWNWTMLRCQLDIYVRPMRKYSQFAMLQSNLTIDRHVLSHYAQRQGLNWGGACGISDFRSPSWHEIPTSNLTSKGPLPYLADFYVRQLCWST